MSGDFDAECKHDMARDEAEEMHDVLAWASENVALYRQGSTWNVRNVHNLKSDRYPTLYQALHAAWSKRDE